MFDYLFPEVNQFKDLLNTKDRVEMPMATVNLFSEHTTDYDDMFEPEANTPDGLIPNSWVDESGIRHAVVWNLDEEIRYTLINGHVLLKESVF